MDPEMPLAPGQEHVLTVDNLAFGGDGVGRVEGVPIFVPDVCPGETVRVRVAEVHQRYARGALIAVETPSPDRVEPTCPLYGECGGCHLQHLGIAAQRAAKTQIVREALRRIGHLEGVPVADIVPSPAAFGYRNKLDLEVAPGSDGGLVVGFHAREAKQVVDVLTCPLARPELNGLLAVCREWLAETGWPPYDPATRDGLVRGLELRWSATADEATVLLTTGRRDVPEKKPWIDDLGARVEQMVGFDHLARTRASQSTAGREVGGLLGRGLAFKLAGLSVRVSPQAFFQVNDLLVEPMVDHLRTILAPSGQDHLVDLYGGVGTFGLALANEVGKVTVIELDYAAVQDGYANARFNKRRNANVVRGQVEQRLAEVARQGRLDLAILDPPRRGCSEAVLRVLAQARPRRIAYVSCDPNTLARDLARLDGLGYATAGVQPFDLFPQTTHIEAVAAVVAA